MKKLILFILTITLLAGCNAASQEPTNLAPTDSGIQTTQVENVFIQISDISSSGATITITDKNPEPYVYGEWFKIQRLTDGQWQNLSPIISDYGFNEIGYLPGENGELKLPTNWEWLYGQLPAGTYRIFKQVSVGTIFIDFTI